MATNKSIYPEIIVDPNSQCANPGMPVVITAEMWYDIMHYTHISNGSVANPDSFTNLITTLTTQLSEVTTKLDATSKKLDEVSNKLDEYIDNDLYISDTIQNP